MTRMGSCHCGNVKFEADVKVDRAMECNCSVCLKRGSLLAFVPEENFRLINGAGSLTDYQFGQKTIHHLFCGRCGIMPFGLGATPDGKKMRAINVRCLDGIDLASIQIDRYDGRSL